MLARKFTSPNLGQDRRSGKNRATNVTLTNGGSGAPNFYFLGFLTRLYRRKVWHIDLVVGVVADSDIDDDDGDDDDDDDGDDGDGDDGDGDGGDGDGDGDGDDHPNLTFQLVSNQRHTHTYIYIYLTTYMIVYFYISISGNLFGCSRCGTCLLVRQQINQP